MQNTPCPLRPALEAIATCFVDLVDLFEEFGDGRLPIDAPLGRPREAFAGQCHDVRLGYAPVRGHLLVDGSDHCGP